MDDSEKDAWRLVWQSSRAARRAQANAPALSGVAAPPKKALWNAPGATAIAPVPLAHLVETYKETPPEERRQRAKFDANDFIAQACRDQTSLPGDTPAFKLCGCQAEKKNVCRETLPQDRRDHLDNICQLLNQFVDSTKPAEVKLADRLVLLEATEAERGACLQAVALLLDVRLRPKMQFLCWACPKADSASSSFELIAAHNVRAGTVVSLCTRLTGFSRCFRTLNIVSSDDFAFALVGHATNWVLRPLEWEFADGTNNLMDMRILRRGDAFTPRAPRARPSRMGGAPSRVWATLSAADPFDLRSAAAAVFGDPDPAPAPPEDLEGVELAELPPDLVRDVIDEQLDQRNLVLDDPPVDEAMDDEAEVAQHTEDEQESLAVAGAEAEAAVPTVDDWVRESKVDGLGYISCALPPFMPSRILRESRHGRRKSQSRKDLFLAAAPYTVIAPVLPELDGKCQTICCYGGRFLGKFRNLVPVWPEEKSWAPRTKSCGQDWRQPRASRVEVPLAQWELRRPARALHRRPGLG